MRTAAVLFVWAAAALVLVGTAISAFVGRADFGDGAGPSVSAGELVALVALDVFAVGMAIWLTRRLLRRR